MISCERIQAALSARLDGEPGGLEDDVVDAHVASCAHCQQFVERSASLNRKIRVRDPYSGVATPPDLSAVIIAGVEPAWRKHATLSTIGRTASRALMVLAGLSWIAHAVVVVRLYSLELEPLAASLYMEAMAMRLALAFGLVFAAWLPRISGELLPLYGALWAFSVGFSARDMVLGTMLPGSFIQLALLSLSVLLLAWSWVSQHRWDIRSLGVQPTHV